MEELKFGTSAQFLKWARMVVKHKLQNYDRTPVGKQTWTYANGHVVEGEMGKRGGTMLSNLAFTLKTATGGLEHSRDAQVVSDIDTRGGVTIRIDWG